MPARPAEAGLHLVDAEERAVAAAELLRAAQVAVGREVDALALTGSTMKSATSSRAELPPRAPRGRRTAPLESPAGSGPKRSVNAGARR